MEDLVSAVLSLIFTVLALIITKFLIPYLKAKLGKERFALAVSMVAEAIRWAEANTNVSKSGKEKKDSVIKFLDSRGIKVDPHELDVLIDSAVSKMNQEIKK